MTDKEWVEKLPKVDLHYHFDGSMRLETVYDILKKRGENVTLESIREETQVTIPSPDLAAFLSKFKRQVQCEQTASDIERVAFEHVEDAARENVMYLEIIFAPANCQREGLPVLQALDAALAGLERGMKRYDVVSRLVVCGMRSDSVEKNTEVVKAALLRKDAGVAAVNIAGDEVNSPPLSFAYFFDAAREGGLPLTIHAGEAGDPQYLKEAVMLGASRIGHGVHLNYDENLVRFFASRRIPLEMCPTSNVLTGAVPSLAAHPIRDYFDDGLVVTVNTDDKTVENTTLAREILLVMETFHFTRDEIVRLTGSAIDAAFCDDSIKRRLRERLARYSQGVTASGVKG